MVQVVEASKIYAKVPQLLKKTLMRVATCGSPCLISHKAVSSFRTIADHKSSINSTTTDIRYLLSDNHKEFFITILHRYMEVIVATQTRNRMLVRRCSKISTEGLL